MRSKPLFVASPPLTWEGSRWFKFDYIETPVAVELIESLPEGLVTEGYTGFRPKAASPGSGTGSRATNQ